MKKSIGGGQNDHRGQGINGCLAELWKIKPDETRTYKTKSQSLKAAAVASAIEKIGPAMAPAPMCPTASKSDDDDGPTPPCVAPIVHTAIKALPICYPLDVGFATGHDKNGLPQPLSYCPWGTPLAPWCEAHCIFIDKSG